VPASEAVRSLVRSVNSDERDILLFASALPEATLMVLVQSDGTPLLIRSSAETWGHDPARVGVDIHRTVLFVQEQFQKSVSHIWLQGPGSEAAAALMSGQFTIPLNPLREKEDPLFWAQFAAGLNGRHPLNLVTREQKEEGSRRLVFRLSLAVAAILLLLSVAFFAHVESLHRQESTALQTLHQEEERLLKRHSELQAIHAAASGQETFLRELGAGRQAPVHAWILGYLSESLPPELVVTNLVARSQSNGWEFVIQGKAQSTPTRGEGRPPRDDLAWFTNAVATGPFHLHLRDTESGIQPLAGVRDATNSPSGWAGRVRLNQRAPRSAESLQFSLTGTLP
jgi:hypothetical protein